MLATGMAIFRNCSTLFSMRSGGSKSNCYYRMLIGEWITEMVNRPFPQQPFWLEVTGLACVFPVILMKFLFHSGQKESRWCSCCLAHWKRLFNTKWNPTPINCIHWTCKQAISCQCCQRCQNSIKNAAKLARWAVQIANKLPDEQMLFPSLPGHPCKFVWFDFLKLLLISSAGCETFVPTIYWLLLKMKAWIGYRGRINFSGGWLWFLNIY